MWILLDGKFYQENQAIFSLVDRGFLFGEGIFTTLRVHKGKIEFFFQHLQRLKEHAHALKFTLPPFKSAWIEELIRLNEASKGTWRLKILITVKRENQICTGGHLAATLEPYSEDFSLPRTLSLFPTPCYRPLAHLKSLSHLDLLYVKDYAIAQGHHDALMQTEKGYVLETSTANFFWINQAKCWIPDLRLPYLKGIILTTLIDHLPLPLHFAKKKLIQIPSTAHLYVCNSLIHIQPIIAIDRFSFQRNLKWENLLKNTLKKGLSHIPHPLSS